ncbi:ATP-dependent DNA helicase [Pediococcus stilesii]|uniref:ATP-dependent DNA helicase n=1 Tax=Pediococcus stilesii TaxID=331679 RepID=A0A5R9BWV7_9LACO|nr:ATP-dependent DNA helicase [Pediococcus stilesii]TLQ05194.1 ATP-dependent DNA helicase [Pediococcus stilesii]
MAATKIGIRQLVEFILRTGDLNAAVNSQNTALEGARIHRKLQKQRGEDYEKEYYIKRTVDMDDEQFTIEGRADGVVIGDELFIEEIKTSDPTFDELSENTKTLYWSQAKVYGAILTQDLDFDRVTIQLTYYQRPTDAIVEKQQEFSRSELKKFFDELIEEYEQWLKLRSDWRKERNQAARKLEFPFPEYRNGQRDLAVAVYKTILTSQRMFVEAPTGTGKTISTMFPTIKALGEEKIDRFFYLTAKQSTQHVAEEAIKLMSEHGLKLKSITLTAKDRMIFPEEVDVKPEDNPYMIGYYDRIKDGIKDVLLNENQLVKDKIQMYAKKHMLDPFEFSLDLSLFCDLIIGDYNYLFDPMVYLQRFFSTEDQNNFFLIDEAHNLVSRSRAMYSAEINQDAVIKVQELFKKAKGDVDSKQIKRRLTQLDNELELIHQAFSEQSEEYMVENNPLDALEKAMLNFNEAGREWLPKQPDNDLTSGILDLFFINNKYVKISEYFDESYRVLIKNTEAGINIQEQILDPSPYLDASLKKGRGAVFFSATLSPVDYYQETLGSSTGLSLRMASPFDQNQQNLLLTSYIDTRFAARQNSLPQIVASVAALVDAKEGNYLIFCPSYGYLTQIADAFKELVPDVKVTVQTNQMTAEDRKAYLDAFREEKNGTLVGFAVLGGIFSEGIDLTEEQLIGVGIVSVGLPGLSIERKLLQNYFDEKNGHGFEYAYQLPGMNHVLQAAGRLIRTNKDRGNIVLMDQRFVTSRYTNLFPRHWSNYRKIYSVTALQKAVKSFWGR